MGDAAIGSERSIDIAGYSHFAVGDRASHRSDRSGLSRDATNESSEPDLSSLIGLGALKLETGNHAEAQEFLLKALKVADRTLEADHPDLILLLNDLTRVYLKQSAYTAAEPLLLRLLEMKRAKGEDHPEVATVLASLATVRQALGHHESAEQLWRRSLDIRERTLAPNHFSIATALEHLGHACAARGKIREALIAFERAHTIRERTLGANHASLRSSRERIADLQLQASDGSIEPSAGDLPEATPEKYRLLAGESVTLTASAIAKREIPPFARRATAVIQGGFPGEQASESATTVNAPHAAVPGQQGALDYRDALESLREELERPYENETLATRCHAFVSSVIESIGVRNVVTGGVALAILLLGIAAATGTRAWGETDQAVSDGSGRTHESVQAVAPAARPFASPGTGARDPVSVPVSTASNTVTKASALRPRMVAEPRRPKKAAEERTETRKLAIPTLSTAVLSRLDSVASRAEQASRVSDRIALEPAPSTLGTRAATFDYGDQGSGPRRARLIGELPTPRVPTGAAGVEGEVRVQFNVDIEGRPVMSTLSVANSPDPRLTAAVARVIPGMRFEPARSGSASAAPIVDVVQVRFQFTSGKR